MSENLKELVGKELARRVKDGDVIGVGTGSTVNAALMAIKERVVSESLSVHVVPTSYQSAWVCEEIGMQVLYPGYRAQLDWGFDGADKADKELRLIKGGGGALLQEKILAARCKKYIIIVDETKLVQNLGAAFPIPIEVIPEAVFIVEAELPKLGAKEVTIRKAVSKAGPVITEGGHLIIDACFDSVPDTLERDLNAVVGVVENGLFTNYATEMLVASKKGVESIAKSG